MHTCLNVHVCIGLYHTKSLLILVLNFKKFQAMFGAAFPSIVFDKIFATVMNYNGNSLKELLCAMKLSAQSFYKYLCCRLCNLVSECLSMKFCTIFCMSFLLVFVFAKYYVNFHCVKSVQIQSYFWSVFSSIRTEYGDLLRKYPYSVRIQENTDQE